MYACVCVCCMYVCRCCNCKKVCNNKWTVFMCACVYVNMQVCNYVCTYVYTYVCCMYVCMCAIINEWCVHVYVYVYVCTYVCISVCMSVCTRLVCMYVCTCICMYICSKQSSMQVLMYTHVFTYTYMYIHIYMYITTCKCIFFLSKHTSGFWMVSASCIAVMCSRFLWSLMAPFFFGQGNCHTVASPKFFRYLFRTWKKQMKMKCRNQIREITFKIVYTSTVLNHFFPRCQPFDGTAIVLQEIHRFDSNSL